MKIKQMAFIGLPVTNVARARKFYEGTLGLQAGETLQLEGGYWWIEYDLHGATLVISDHLAPAGKGGAVLAFEVDDLDAWKKTLTEQGRSATDTVDTPVCRFFSCKDPDGNDLTIHQLKGRHH
ncbi:MAG: VOC family protein [Verrucomicrobiales bacterium]|nr:VOC family protein [Verrucomicrobiales bacterium]